MRRTTAGFGVIRLNTHSQTAWAVVELPSGAIALDSAERLLIRLSEDEARRLAKVLAQSLLFRDQVQNG